MRYIRDRLTFANVVSVIALFVALGGTAVASVIISSNSQVGPNTISGHKPPSGDHANIIGGSVNATDLANSAVTGGKLAPNSVNSAKVVNGSLQSADTDTSSIQRRVNGNCPSGQAVQSVTQTGGLNCGATNGGSPGGTAGGDLTGTYPNPSLGPDVVGTSNFASGAKAPDADLLDGVDSTSYGGVMSAGVQAPSTSVTVAGFGAASGVSALSGTATQVASLSPGQDLFARDFSVKLSNAPGSGSTVVVSLQLDGASTVACGMSGAQTTCTGSLTPQVPAGTTLALKIEEIPAGAATIPQTQITTGFLMTPG